MKLIVVGGHTRNIGKTSLAASLIREFRCLNWTAVKITQYGHGVCSHDGKSCQCAPRRHAFTLTEEQDPTGQADTCRFLAAGAQRSAWMRVRQGQLGGAFPTLKRFLSSDRYVLIESNSILAFIRPDLYLVVLDATKRDFKDSTRNFLHAADALIPVVFPLVRPDQAHATVETKGQSEGRTVVARRWFFDAAVLSQVSGQKAQGQKGDPEKPQGQETDPALQGSHDTGEWDNVWPGIEPQRTPKPVFPVGAGDYFNPDLCRFVRLKLRLE
jgi:hypothetical protein